MEDIYEELKKSLNLKERIILRLNKRLFKKIYNKIRINLVNSLLKN